MHNIFQLCSWRPTGCKVYINLLQLVISTDPEELDLLVQVCLNICRTVALQNQSFDTKLIASTF